MKHCWVVSPPPPKKKENAEKDCFPSVAKKRNIAKSRKPTFTSSSWLSVHLTFAFGKGLKICRVSPPMHFCLTSWFMAVASAFWLALCNSDWRIDFITSWPLASYTNWMRTKPYSTSAPIARSISATCFCSYICASQTTFQIVTIHSCIHVYAYNIYAISIYIYITYIYIYL